MNLIWNNVIFLKYETVSHLSLTKQILYPLQGSMIKFTGGQKLRFPITDSPSESGILTFSLEDVCFDFSVRQSSHFSSFKRTAHFNVVGSAC